jgi:muramidase (phage lysozyme)
MTDIIANILLREIGSTPKVQPVTPSTGLGAMTSRKGITAPQEEQQADPTQNIQRPIIDIYRKIVQQEIGDGSGLTGEKIPYDPLVDTPETLAARGYNPDEVLRNSVFSSTISGTKGRTPKDKVLTDIEDLIQSYEDKRLAKKRSVSKERATASSSILDVLEAELMRGMTSKQTDTQPTVSADSSRDRFELQGDMRDLPVLDDEGAPEVDTLSNELLDKELPSDGLGSRPVAEVQTDDDMGLPERDIPDYNFMLPGSEFRKALKEKEAESYATIFADSQKKDTPFKDVDVTEMTMDEVLKFVKLNGPFHKYNKNTHNKNTTAIGKYQFVGATLRDLKKRGVFTKLGIKEDTLFDEDTQDKLSAYQAIHRIKDRSDGTFSSARKEMRNEWEGFKKLSDTKLDIIIKEIADEIGVKIIKTPPSELAPKTSLRPKARPDTRIASN